MSRGVDRITRVGKRTLLANCRDLFPRREREKTPKQINNSDRTKSETYLNKLPCRFHGGIFRGSAAHTKIGDGRHSDKLHRKINEKSENDRLGLRFRGHCPRVLASATTRIPIMILTIIMTPRLMHPEHIGNSCTETSKQTR